jgi:hypothetical protein
VISPRPRLRLGLRWFACLLATGLAGSAQSWSPRLDLGYVYNDNTSNSIREEKADNAVTARIELSQVRVLDRDWQGSITVGADTAVWQEFSGLNLSHVDARVGVRRKFGLGPYATKLDLSFRGMHQIADVPEWSGNGYHAQATLQKRFTPQLSGSLVGDLRRFDAERFVYSGTVAAITSALVFDITPDWRISGSLRYAEGTQLSWCRESFPEFAGKGPQWQDGIFGGDWFPYKDEGHLRGFNLSIGRAIGDRSSFALGFDASESRAASHIYRNQITSLNFTHAF